MIDLSRDGYTHEQVRNVLHMRHGSRQVRFRYFLLDKNDFELAEITENMLGGTIEQNAFSEIKRTAKFRMKETMYVRNGKEHEINFNTDRIQVFMEIKMPDEYQQNIVDDEEWYFITPVFVTEGGQKIERTKKEGGWISFSLGIFLLASPTKQEQGKSIYREIEAYDKLLILRDDKIDKRITLSAGGSYYNAMRNILLGAGVTKINIENTGKTLPNDKEYEPGTSRLSIANDLASDINFTQIWIDEYGYARSEQYRSPAEQAPDYEYTDDDLSVMLEGSEEELDLFDIPNVFTVVVSNPDIDEIFTSTVVNNNPDHPRSVPNLGRRVVRFEEKDDIADQAALDSYVERLAFESSQIYGRVRFRTAIMPFHSYSNVLRIRNQTLVIDDKYSEVSWSIPLEPGGEMEHEVRKVVSLI